MPKTLHRRPARIGLISPTTRPAVLTRHRMADPTSCLLERMRAAGIKPSDPSAIILDHRVHRFHVEGDKRGSRNGWAVLYADHGAGGSWKAGVFVTWSARDTWRMTRQEKGALARMREAKVQALRERDTEHKAAAARAAELWGKTRPAAPHHPYLVKKRIAPGPARQLGEMLVLRIVDADDNLHGLQFIGPDGQKRMLTGTDKRGHLIWVVGSLPADVIIIAEGFATAATVARDFAGAAVLAAIDCGNLPPVAEAIRARHPAAKLVIAADDDRLTPGNPGLTRAREAARSVGATLIRPAWPPGSPLELSDFNDAACFMEAAHV